MLPIHQFIPASSRDAHHDRPVSNPAWPRNCWSNVGLREGWSSRVVLRGGIRRTGLSGWRVFAGTGGALAWLASAMKGVRILFCLKSEKIEGLICFSCVYGPQGADQAGLIPFLAQELRVPCEGMWPNGDQKSGDDNHFQWCEFLSDDL
jgi:hypothetical protein